MDDSPPLVCPAPRISKACESCRSRKLRCLPSDSAGICKRCLSLKIDCKFAAGSSQVIKPGGGRKEQPTGSRSTSKSAKTPVVAEDEDVLNILFQSKPQGQKANSLGMIKSIHQQIFNKIIPSSPYWSSVTTPLAQSTANDQTSSAEENGSAHQQPAPKLGKDDIRKYLTRFQESQTYFPFSRLPQEITIEAMMKNHPFLLLGILAAMSMPDIYIHQKLDAKFKRVFSEKTIERDEKSLDLLQGLLVYLAWYPVHLNPKSLQIFKFLQMAVGLTQDLKFDQPPDLSFDPVDLDSVSYNSSIGSECGGVGFHAERLAYLGCYHLSTSILVPFGQTNTLPFTAYTQSCVDATPVNEADARAYTLVKTQRLTEQAAELNRSGPHFGYSSLESEIESLIVRLDILQRSLSAATASHPSIIFALDFVRQRIYATPLPMPKCQIHPPSPRSSTILSYCLSSVITLMTYITALPVTAYATFTLSEWNHIIDNIVTLSRLCFPIPSVPDWNAGAARQAANFTSRVSALQERLEEVTKYMARGTSTPSSKRAGGTNKHHEQKKINITSLFSAVLTIVLQQYSQRLTQETPYFPGTFPLEDPVFPHSLEEQEIMYPLKTSQCPVMNGSLKGTEYWDDMDAFKNEVSGDAWMGHAADGGGGDVMFESAVLEDWLLWGTKLPGWDGGMGG